MTTRDTALVHCPWCGRDADDSHVRTSCRVLRGGLTFPEVDTSDLADLRRRVEAENRDIPMQGIPVTDNSRESVDE